jgi:two-component system response regulator AtoC
VLLDVRMPETDGLETLEAIREASPGLPVVMLSVEGRTSTIVRAMQLGADDYLTKPFQDEEVELALRKVLTASDRVREKGYPVAEVEVAVDETAVWSSPAMQATRRTLEQVGTTNVTVLIQGESGVGKEVVARTAHSLSDRSERPFVKVNCAALPETLLESELFGYEQGAFTGAAARKYGKFELAHTGTIFLDEIGEMALGLQAKLLQVLQDAEFTRLGGNEDIHVDVRIITATNRNLAELVQQGRFREDLFFRLDVVNVTIPPLRERMEEIPALLESFQRRFAARYGKHLMPASEELLAAFADYPFNGNVRELENMVRRTVVLESEESILAEIAEQKGAARFGGESLHALLEELEDNAGDLPLREVGQRASREVEREVIDQVLLRTGWNRKQAARLLGVSYKTLLHKIRECGLHPL